MDVKMIICDLDGTLLRSDKTISPYTLDILHKCRKAGIELGIATARSQHGARIITDVFAPDVLIYDGGAMSKIGDLIIFGKAMNGDIAAKLARLLLQKADYVAAENDEVYYYGGGPPTPYANELKNLGFTVEETDFAVPFGSEVHKVSAFIQSSDAAEIVKYFPDVDITQYHGEILVRFAHKHAAKWQAVAATSNYFGIDIKNIAAFGDNYNDVEMLENCGIGVAMENAIYEAKAAAKYVCGSNDNDGVARFIEENILQNNLEV